MIVKSVLVLLAAWAGTGLVQFANHHALGLALLMLAAMAVVCFMRPAAPSGAGAPRRAIPIIAVLIAIHLIYALNRLIWHPILQDIGQTTLDAGHLLIRGLDPYAAFIDPGATSLLPAGYAGDAHDFGGFKYGPVTAAIYMPLGLPFGGRGLIATNFLLVMAVLALVWHLGRRLHSPLAGALGAGLLAAVPLMIFQNYAKCVTDLVPTALLLAALACQSRRPDLAGLALGLSISAKLAPGLAMLPFLLPGGRRGRFALGLGTGLVPLLLAGLMSPRAVTDNLLLFNLLRQRDDTSWLFGASPVLAQAMTALFVIGWLAASFWFLARPREDLARCRAIMAVTIGLLLTGPAAHENYMIWWLPFFTMLVGCLAAGTWAKAGLRLHPA